MLTTMPSGIIFIVTMMTFVRSKLRVVLLEGSLVKENNCNDNYECILFDDG
jgi:hypothetical protein